jgi:hypothetical protein
MMRREKEDQMAKYTRTHYSRPEAMKLYIELLARVHTESDYLARNEDSADPQFMQCLGAQRQLEDLICTTRESLCSSGAWNRQFAEELNARPFCMVVDYCCDDYESLGEKCAACNRKSDHLSYKMYLFGSRYNSSRFWSSVRWDRELAANMYFYSKQEQDEEEEEEEEEEDGMLIDPHEGQRLAEKRWSWWNRNTALRGGGKDTVLKLGSTCRRRSELYHHLLHYKFRLLLKIKDKLGYCGGNVSELMRDAKFLDTETRRFTNILKQANQKWGGSEQQRAGRDIWSDDEGTPGRISLSGRRSVGAGDGVGISGQLSGGGVSGSERRGSAGTMRRWLSWNTEQVMDSIIYLSPLSHLSPHLFSSSISRLYRFTLTSHSFRFHLSF